MIGVSTPGQAAAADRAVIDGLGVPGIALMETASKGVAEVVRDLAGSRGRVVVVCGGGNNGGDGFGCARWLHGWGIDVAVWPLTDESAPDAAIMRRAAAAAGVRTVGDLAGATLIVDAVLGTGLCRPVVGRHAKVIEAMAAHEAPIVAVDVPSGLDAGTGAVLGAAARAVATVTFGSLKVGQLAEPGASLVGELHLIDIGIPVGVVPMVGELPEPVDLAPLWPVRDGGDHKRSSGHLYVVAGSSAMAGAAMLTCVGALAAGVGLVTLVAPKGALRLDLPKEVMWMEAGSGDALEPTDLLAGRATALAVGPGLGSPGAKTGAWLSDVWANSALPCVFDADGLAYVAHPTSGMRVITPHPGEARRLLGGVDVQSDRFGAVRALSTGRVALLKGRNTLITGPNRPISVNPTGNHVLATGGSGDVLTGVIGALLARGLAPFDAARLGAWVHGRAGEELAALRGQGWTASDVATAIPDAVEALRTEGLSLP